MEHDRRPAPGGELPGDRLTRLGQASRLINESLDVDAALQRASARGVLGECGSRAGGAPISPPGR